MIDFSLKTEPGGIKMIKIPLTAFLLFLSILCQAEDGYRLWLRYDKIEDAVLLSGYAKKISSINFEGTSPVLLNAKKELWTALSGLLGKTPVASSGVREGSLLVTKEPATATRYLSSAEWNSLGPEGFLIRTVQKGSTKLTLLTATTDAGILYGVFHFL